MSLHGVWLAVPRSSLDPHESNPQDPLPLSEGRPWSDGAADISFRHRGWAPARARVAKAMERAMVHEHRIMDFFACGQAAFVMRSKEDPSVFKVRCARCRDRFCKPCARERAGIVARNLLAHVQDRRVRFVTLTLKTQSPDLRSELDRLYDSFQQLRRRTFWQKRVRGGAALLEVKWSSRTERWHPHLHVIVEGGYIPQGKLRDEWLEVTGDSYIVDVRAIPDNRRTIRYVTKYATDPVDASVSHSVDLLAQVIPAMKGRRSCLTFGCWRGVELTTGDDEDAWEIVATLNETIYQADHGVGQDRDVALMILQQLWSYDPHDDKGGDSTDHARPPPPHDTIAVPF